MEKLEPLGKFSIYTTDDHSFGTDAVLLSNFAAEKNFSKACDLGTGCGIIPLLLLKDHSQAVITGVEIQSEACRLCKKSALLNNVEDRFEVVEADIKALKGKVNPLGYDLVTCNPPYKADGTGIKNINSASAIARHEVLCSFKDIAAAAAQLLKFSGRFCVCHRPERLADVIYEMRYNGIEPKRIREVIQRKGGSAWLILVEGRLHGNKGIVFMPPLYIEENNQFSDEMMQIYGDYKEGRGKKI